MKPIFISYKRKDLDKVKQIVSFIEKSLNVECWIDIDGIESSAEFESKICFAIDESKVVLFMFSENHLNLDFDNDYTVNELRYAKMTKKPVILVKLDNTPLYNIFLFNFGSKNNIDINDPIQKKKLIDDLRVKLDLPKVSSTEKQAKKPRTAESSSSGRTKQTHSVTIPASFSTTPGNYCILLKSPGDPMLTKRFLASLPGITPALADDYMRLTPLNIIRNISEQDARLIISIIEQLGGNAVAYEEEKTQPAQVPVTSARKQANTSTSRSSGSKTSSVRKRTTSSSPKVREYSVVLVSVPNITTVGRVLSLLSGKSSLNLLNLPLVIHKTTSYETASKWKKRLEFVGAKVEIV